MSHELTVEVSDAAFDALATAATANGVTPAELVADSVERQFGSPNRNRSDIRKWFGKLGGAGPIGLDNEQIDADLAQEYAGRRDPS